MTDTPIPDEATEAFAAAVLGEGWTLGNRMSNMQVLALVERGLAAAQPALTRAAVEAERERIADAIRGSVSYGYGMNPDGTEDPLASAYVEGIHTAYDIARAGGDPHREGRP